MTEEDQCSAFASIGLLACAGARTLSNPARTGRPRPRRPRCSVCDSPQQGKHASSTWEGDQPEELFKFVAKLLKTPQLQRSIRPRIAAMAALRRLLFHTASISHLNMAKSTFGQWCMQALHSSIRDLRFAAGSVEEQREVLQLADHILGGRYLRSCAMMLTYKSYGTIVF